MSSSVETMGFAVLATALLGILVASVLCFVKRRYLAGTLNVLLFLGCLVSAVYSVVYVFIATVTGKVPDGFPDHLVVPSDIDIAEPETLNAHLPDMGSDALQSSILSALMSERNPDLSIPDAIDSLVYLQQNHPQLLMWYLSASPCWRVIRKNRQYFAMRRWKMGDDWIDQGEGHYSEWWLDDTYRRRLPDFDFSFRIGISGKTLYDHEDFSTVVSADGIGEIRLHQDSGVYESHCILKGPSILIELGEASEHPERTITRLALSYLDSEFRPLADNPSCETATNIMPLNSIRRGTSSFNLKSKPTFSGGYISIVRTNPGEPGLLYLKAFEVTTNIPLSERILRHRTEELAGWSSDPEESFYASSDFTIAEGDSDHPYAARFEVWFEPFTGTPERKLLDRVYRISGFP